jgi:transposase InsO family protein
MECIAMDILCELPVTNGGNKHILVIGDYYTKWTECFAMPNMEAKTVATLLVEEVIVRFGTPYVIHTDQGLQFESILFQETCRLLQIEKTRTTPYHPQSDGMVERNNRTILTILSAFVNEHQNDWDEHLPYISMAYRAAEHETTEITPNYMMLGREVTTRLDIQYCMPRSIAHIPQNRWAWIPKDRREETH